MKISVVVPAYNEEKTIILLLNKVNEILNKKFSNDFEIIVVDDGSTDSTNKLLIENKKLYTNLITLSKNQGKGFAIKKSIEVCNGEIVIIQDADLEYSPDEYPRLLVPFDKFQADVVYGSRFKSSELNRVLFFWHSIANKIITLISNIFSDLNLTDVETGFKAFRKKTISNISLTEKSFGIEIELTHKLANIKPKLKFFEVGISYNGRTYDEGKKIGIKDAFRAIYCILKFGLIHKIINSN